VNKARATTRLMNGPHCFAKVDVGGEYRLAEWVVWGGGNIKTTRPFGEAVLASHTDCPVFNNWKIINTL